MSSQVQTSDQDNSIITRKNDKRRRGIKIPNMDTVDLEKFGIDEAWRPILKKVFSKSITINEKLHEMKSKGFQQNWMSKLLGVSEGAISQRLSGTVGRLDVAEVDRIERHKKMKDKREIQKILPYTDYLLKLLRLNGVQKTKEQRVMDLYAEYPSIFDNEQNFYDLLRSQKVSKVKAKLITGLFFKIL